MGNSMSKIVKSVCFAFLISCANVPTDTESVATAYDELVAGGGAGGTAGYHSGGKAGTSGKAGGGGGAGYYSGGTTGTAGTSNTGGYHSGGTAGTSTAGTGNIAGNPPCWDDTTTPTPFGDNTEANQAANNGAEAGWADGYAIGCAANDEESASKSTSTLSQSSYFCWPGGRHRFCVYAAAWATARACVSLSCDGRTVSACAYASAYAFAWSCSGPIWYYWW